MHAGHTQGVLTSTAVTGGSVQARCHTLRHTRQPTFGESSTTAHAAHAPLLVDGDPWCVQTSDWSTWGTFNTKSTSDWSMWGIYRSSVDARKPQCPTKSEEYRRHLQGVLYST
eukprot:4319755-Pyramimonas_sp.AAC.1